MYNPDEMPRNEAEFTQLIDHYYEQGQQRHAQAVASAKAAAEAQYTKLPDTKDKPTLSDFIAQAVSMVEPAPTRRELETTYACYRPQPEPDAAMPEAQPEPAQAIYQLADGRLYDVESGEILKARSADPDRLIILPIGTEADLRETLECYGLPIPAFLCTQDELFARLRSARDTRIAATDYLLTPDYPITEDKRAAVTIYRAALRDLPAQPGAPWDGGGKETPWPVMAEAE